VHDFRGAPLISAIIQCLGVHLVCHSRNAAKRSLILALALFSVSSLAMAQQESTPNSGSWSGVIINSNCTADEAFNEDAKCTADVPGAKLSFFDDTTRQLFVLDPQDQAAGHLGDSVTVSGSVEGNTLHVASFKLLTDIGLAVGQKAPAFTARDQFGQEQSLATLKGPNGTVLLFFRSADW
jgi:hypothetical protein